MQPLTYKIAKCCTPEENNSIIGYFKEEGIITVHLSIRSFVGGIPIPDLIFCGRGFRSPILQDPIITHW